MNNLKAFDPHVKNGEFQEWLIGQIEKGNIVAWKGKDNEKWVDYESYCKVYFRTWAMKERLPIELWEEVFKEFLED